MFIDLHMHEMRNSGDSYLTLEEIVEIAKKKGLDAICITDHDNMDIRSLQKNIQQKQGIPSLWELNFTLFREILSPMGSRITQESALARRNLLILSENREESATAHILFGITGGEWRNILMR